MNTTKNIQAGTKFRILLGMPRTGTVTKVTKARVFYNVDLINGEVTREVTTRGMMDNAAMIEVL